MQFGFLNHREQNRLICLFFDSVDPNVTRIPNESKKKKKKECNGIDGPHLVPPLSRH